MENRIVVKEKEKCEQRRFLLKRRKELRKKFKPAFMVDDLELVAQLEKEDEEISIHLIDLDFNTAKEIDDYAYDEYERHGIEAAEVYIKATMWKYEQERKLEHAA